MKKKEFEKMKHRSEVELKKEIAERKEKLWQTKKEIANGKEKDVHKALKLKREIAQLNTLLNRVAIEQSAKK